MNMKTNRVFPHLEQIEWIGKLADMKEAHYQHSLLLSAVIELLIDKGIISAQEIAAKAQAIENADAASAAYPVMNPAGDTPF